jgi:Na+-driven multidrug efflux pump
MGERALAQVLLVGLVAPFGDASLAAYGLTQRLQMFVNLGHQGLGVSAGILVGQNLGARQLARAKATAWWGIGFSSLMTLAVGALLLAYPRSFLTVFSREDALLDAAVPWLQIMVVGFLAMGIGQVFVQVFNTAGDTLVSMLVTLVTIWGVQQPAALLLSGAPFLEISGLQIPLPTIGGLGEYGIAWAISFGMLIRLAVYVPYFLWGPWWKKKVY